MSMRLPTDSVASAASGFAGPSAQRTDRRTSHAPPERTDSRQAERGRRWISGLLTLSVCAVLGAGCPGVDVTIRSYWPNGQLKFVAGGHDANHTRNGVWVYFTQTGDILYEQTYSDGSTYLRTGVYESGKRVRLPTEQEILEARETARRIMEESARLRAR